MKVFCKIDTNINSISLFYDPPQSLWRFSLRTEDQLAQELNATVEHYLGEPLTNKTKTIIETEVKLVLDHWIDCGFLHFCTIGLEHLNYDF